MTKEKAYFVWAGDPGLDWGDHFHAESASKAKAKFWKVWSYEVEDYTCLRPIRCPMYDNGPFPDDFWTCDCEVCGGDK